MSIPVVIADDQELVRAGFQMMLDAQPDIEVVGLASDGVEAISLVEQLQPAVALIDIRMPRLDGLEATRRIMTRRRAPNTRVLIVTTLTSTSTSMTRCRPARAASSSKTSHQSSLRSVSA